MFVVYVVILCFSTLAIETNCDLIIPDLPILPKLCGGSSDAKEASFLSGDSLLSKLCTFELIIKPETCGVRIDFVEFSFNEPTRKDNVSAFLCGPNLDVLKLSVLGLPLLDLSVFCGHLSGQHINIPTRDYDAPLLKTVLKAKLILTVISVGGRISGLPKPSWNIKLTQIPCYGIQKEKLPELPLKSLAPIGCFQYFTEKQGRFESFNFRNGTGHYFGNLNYAICFKRYPNTCGIRFYGLKVELATNNNSSLLSTERDCDTILGSIDLGINLKLSGDYLLIPDGKLIANTKVGLGANLSASKYCGKSLLNREVVVITQGPLFISVVTDGFSNPLKDSERGFVIHYELLTNCNNIL